MASPITHPTSSEEVKRRYAQLGHLSSGLVERGESNPAATEVVGPVVIREARLLDLCDYEAWIGSWTGDGVLWVPLDPASGPSQDQSLFLDDRRRLEERVRWRGEPSAWGQQPPSTTVRAVSTIEAWPDGDLTVVRSALVLSETRRGRTQLLVGQQLHELTADGLIRSKILRFPQLRVGVRNPSFIL